MLLILLLAIVAILLTMDIFVHWRPSHVGDNRNQSLILAAINLLRVEIKNMSEAIDRIEAGTEKVVADVGNIQRAVNELKGVVADLRAQVAAGQLDQTRLSAAAEKLDKVDSDLDAIAPDTTTPSA